MSRYGRFLCAGIVIAALACASGALALDVTFQDDFESYAVGTNPSSVYDYRCVSWGAPWDPVLPDLYEVGSIGSNKVLQFHYDGPSGHFPKVMKLYKQPFAAFSEAAATFYYTAAEPGWCNITFGYKDDHWLTAGYDSTNYLHIGSRSDGAFAVVALWEDRNIMTLDARVEVRKVGDQLTAAVTRLDTQQTISVSVIRSIDASGQVGFGTQSDWYGGVYFNVDDFMVKGTPVPEPSSLLTLLGGLGTLGGFLIRKRK